MRPLFFLLTLYSLLSIFSALAFAQTKKLVILGDSLTEGYGVAKENAYGSVLENKIKAAGKNWQVVLSGISGSTSASAASRMKWILKSKPQLIVLALGSNDGLRGVKVTETKKNIEAAMQLAQLDKIPLVLAGLRAPPNYGKQYTQEFAQIFIDLAAKYQVKLIPFLLEDVAGVQSLNLADGIHPNEKGHEKLAENVFKVIRSLL